jgi:hypothetical protein
MARKVEFLGTPPPQQQQDLLGWENIEEGRQQRETDPTAVGLSLYTGLDTGLLVCVLLHEHLCICTCMLVCIGVWVSMACMKALGFLCCEQGHVGSARTEQQIQTGKSLSLKS